ncbi:DUF1800 family protein [Emticicia sp. 21SJ11W-3]|uniref:DUF1800 domain-containing protein n=1 Tax=Emticicia sp. 21SJ11W-3 TaxID=2916755 RepID=UPI0020A0FEF3|nr:DUF1800 domain-containing protein [Emticicia sp. 21SJ11W-3]UTA68717.1 DUF1800 domain-containing protein [Emticicia sp. 21SJ11W-3]
MRVLTLLLGVRNATHARVSFVLVVILTCLSNNLKAQSRITFGKGNIQNVTVSSSSAVGSQDGITTLLSSGFLPNKTAAARLLSQATLGATYDEIENVAAIGVESWVNKQLNMPNSFRIEAYLQNLHQSIVDSLRRTDPSKTISNTYVTDRHFDICWFQGFMTAPDVLRWRVAMGLSQIFVTSRVSAFDSNPYALASYYDLLLDGAFGNYRTLLERITYHPAMAVYLTYMNNHATDINKGKQIYPDENYAREIMQLFSIGLFQLNLDGTEKKDASGKAIPTYNNNDIANLAKVFTGLSWADSRYIGEKNKDIWSYTRKLKFYAVDSSDAYLRTWSVAPRIVNAHEQGPKTFLGKTIEARPVEQGELDISDALDIIFNHPNVGPFMARRLIQRMVSSNPTPAYIARVASVFNDNGKGVRGDLKAVIKAILLDPEARDLSNRYTGVLKEPFIRYTNLIKGLNLKSSGGIYRNTMRRAYDRMGQLPLFSPSVFNFFSPDYVPDGTMKETDKYGPEFQIFNAQTWTGYLNALNNWIAGDEPIDYMGYYSAETVKNDQRPRFDLTADFPLTRNDRLVQLLDKYNLILASGRLSKKSMDIIKRAVSGMPLRLANGEPNADDANKRVRVAIYLIMASPEYIINN